MATSSQDSGGDLEIKTLAGIKVPVDPKSLQKIAEFRRAAAQHIAEWEGKSELAREVRDDDRAVERFLIARKFDLPKAIEMFVGAMKWRLENKTDEVLNSPRPDILAIRSAMDNHCEHHFDRQGRPIYIEWVGRLDPSKVMPAYTIDQVMDYQFHATEFRRKILFARGSQLSGKPVDQIVSIVDLENISFGKHLTGPVYDFIKKLSAANQAYYPEFLGRLFIINAPTIFKIAWVIIAPWLDERTRSKISIHSNNGRDALLEVIDENVLPRVLGGTCECTIHQASKGTSGAATVEYLAQLQRAHQKQKEVAEHKLKKEKKKGTVALKSLYDCGNNSSEQLIYFDVVRRGLTEILKAREARLRPAPTPQLQAQPQPQPQQPQPQPAPLTALPETTSPQPSSSLPSSSFSSSLLPSSSSSSSLAPPVPSPSPPLPASTTLTPFAPLIFSTKPHSSSSSSSTSSSVLSFSGSGSTAPISTPQPRPLVIGPDGVLIAPTVPLPFLRRSASPPQPPSATGQGSAPPQPPLPSSISGASSPTPRTAQTPVPTPAPQQQPTETPAPPAPLKSPPGVMAESKIKSKPKAPPPMPSSPKTSDKNQRKQCRSCFQAFKPEEPFDPDENEEDEEEDEYSDEDDTLPATTSAKKPVVARTKSKA